MDLGNVLAQHSANQAIYLGNFLGRSQPTRSTRGPVALFHDVAIDLGSHSTRVYVSRARDVEREVVSDADTSLALEEPSVVAVEARSGEVIEAGRRAETLVASEPHRFTLEHPVRCGVIANEELAQAMVRRFVRPFLGGMFSRSRGIVAVPMSATPTERRAAQDALTRAGVTSAHLIAMPLAAAIGCGLSVTEPEGVCVAIAGAEMTEVGIVALGSVVAHATARVGFQSLTRSLSDMLRREYALHVENRILLGVLKLLEAADEGEVIEVRGRSLLDDVPCVAYLEQREVLVLVQEYRGQVLAVLAECLAKAKPEVSRDVAGAGIRLCGGGASVPGLSAWLSRELKLKFVVPDSPEHVVAIGAGACLVTIGTPTADQLFFPPEGKRR